MIGKLYIPRADGDLCDTRGNSLIVKKNKPFMIIKTWRLSPYSRMYMILQLNEWRYFVYPDEDFEKDFTEHK